MWLPGFSVVPVLAGLVVLDVLDGAVSRWFVDHALTTAALTGILVLLITTLVVDRVIRRGQVQERATAVAAQAGLLARQAQRTAQTVRDALNGKAERDAASEEIRTFMVMLMVSAPLLIDTNSTRTFLESADRLAAVLARVVSRELHASDDTSAKIARAAAAVDAASKPLMTILNPSELAAVDETGDADDGGSDG